MEHTPLYLLVVKSNADIGFMSSIHHQINVWTGAHSYAWEGLLSSISPGGNGQMMTGIRGRTPQTLRSRPINSLVLWFLGGILNRG